MIRNSTAQTQRKNLYRMEPTTSVSNEANSNDKIADLIVISYEKLLNRDEAEAAHLLNACSEAGFFYLDLGGSATSDYLHMVTSLFEFSEEYFTRPLQEKIKDTDLNDITLFNICGYKPLGLDSGNVRNQKDGCEGLRIPIDLVFNPGQDPRLYRPQGVGDKWPLFHQFITESHAMTYKILERLSDALNLQGDERYETRHRADKPSTSTAVLQYYPLTDLPSNTSVGHFTHTDTGSITVLFNTDWGLQVYSPQRDAWEYIAPHPHHAIINVGDGLKFLSGGRLRSSLHRVVPWHGRWTRGPRYANIFFLRPNHDAEFVDTEGNTYTADEWLKKKFGNYRASHQEQMTNAIATGRMGFVGLWDGSAGRDGGKEEELAAAA